MVLKSTRRATNVSSMFVEVAECIGDHATLGKAMKVEVPKL
jgi:hypothetical protein